MFVLKLRSQWVGEPIQYRLRYLEGCDTSFVKFFALLRLEVDPHGLLLVHLNLHGLQFNNIIQVEERYIARSEPRDATMLVQDRELLHLLELLQGHAG